MRIIPTDTLDETEDGGGNSEPSSALLQACGPREPHPRQVHILLDKGSPVTCVKYNGRPRSSQRSGRLRRIALLHDQRDRETRS